MANTNQITILTSDTDGISVREITIASREKGRESPRRRLSTGVNR